MTKYVSCQEAGMDCDFSVQSSDENEIVDMVRKHAKGKHHMDMSAKDVRGLMKDAKKPA